MLTYRKTTAAKRHAKQRELASARKLSWPAVSRVSQAIADMARAHAEQVAAGFTTISSPRHVACPACGAEAGEFCHGPDLRVGQVCEERRRDFITASNVAYGRAG